MRGVQQARIGLFLVLIATGVVIGHVLAIGISDARQQPVVVSEFDLASNVSLASLQGDDAPGYVSLASLEDDSNCCAGGVTTASGCPGCPSASCATANCPPKLYGSTSLTDYSMLDEFPSCHDETDKGSFMIVSGGPAIIDEPESNDCITSCFGPLPIEVPLVAEACESSDEVTLCSNEEELASCDAERKSCACCAAKAKVATCAAECPACPGGQCSADSACETADVECDGEHCAGETQQVAEDVPAPPDALRAPDDATPITTDAADKPLPLLPAPKPDSKKEAEIRSIIESELPQARADERSIWFDELKGLHPEMVRELLRLRKDFNSSGGDAIPKIADALAPAPPMIPEERRGVDFDFETLQSSALFDATQLVRSSQSSLDQAICVILNNIANANTTGFKRSRVEFEDGDYLEVQLSETADSEKSTGASSIAIGTGSQVCATRLDLTQGQLQRTNRTLDLAIIGEGYFQLKNADGELCYTRTGTFMKTSDGSVAMAIATAGSAVTLEPAITIPATANEISISSDGVVSVTSAGNSTPVPVGQIQIVTFANPEGLLPVGRNIFSATGAAGLPRVGNPSTEGRGKLNQRQLEGANVVIANELAALQQILEQKAALERASQMLAPGFAPASPRFLETPDPSQDNPDGKPGRFTVKPPQQTSEHIRPDRAKR